MNNEQAQTKGVYRITKRDKYNRVIGLYYADNLLPTVGRTNIVNNIFSNAPTYSALVNYAGLGTGTNAPANADTTLQTETYRNAIASRTNANNVGYATAFFSATECSGTYREAGLFQAGTGTANSGVLLSRVAINITKSLTESLTLDWSLTLA